MKGPTPPSRAYIVRRVGLREYRANCGHTCVKNLLPLASMTLYMMHLHLHAACHTLQTSCKRVDPKLTILLTFFTMRQAQSATAAAGAKQCRPLPRTLWNAVLRNYNNT